jgi:hypothetical protein
MAPTAIGNPALTTSAASSRFGWLHRFRPLQLALGIVAPALAITISGVTIYRQTTPEIRIATTDPKSPFLFPFFVKNPSPFFGMIEVSPECALAKVRGPKMNWSEMKLRSAAKDIGKGDEKPLQCIFAEIPMEVREAEQTVTLHYKTNVFGWVISRAPTAPEKFVWEAKASNPQWVPYGEAK